MNLPTLVIVVFIVEIALDDKLYASADQHVVKPGVKWLYVGKTLTIKCKVTRKSVYKMCNSTRRKMFMFELETNTSENRKHISDKMTIRCNGTIIMTLPNITASATGLYWCGKHAVNNVVDLKVVDRLHKPRNISCVFYGKRILNCTYSVHDNIGFNQYSCDSRNWDKSRKNNIRHGRCPAKVIDELHEGGHDRQTSVNGGVCSHRCTEVGTCSGNILLVFFGKNVKKNLTYCHVAKLRRILKPGKVRDLRVTNITSSSFCITWRKPADLDNDDDTYRYIVSWVGRRGLTGNITVIGKEEHITDFIPNLRAGWQYDITIKAKPWIKGFASEPSTQKATTKETFPTSGPIVPVGSFSVHEMKYLAIYWKEIPENERGGEIIKYEIMAGSLRYTVNALHHWCKVDLNGLDGDSINVTLSAATKIGCSLRNTTLNISKTNMRQQRIAFVHRKNQSVMWNHTATSLDNVRVYRCYGKQDSSQQQLVDCKTEIEVIDVKNTGQSRVDWVDPPAPALSCVRCQWHYAVSVSINNSTAGMVWNTHNRTHNTVTDRPVKQDALGQYKMIYFVIILLVCVLLTTACVFICIVVRRKLTCEPYRIVLPVLPVKEPVEDVQCSAIDKTRTIALIPEGLNHVPRDSGNDSMERSDVSHKAHISEHTNDSGDLHTEPQPVLNNHPENKRVSKHTSDTEELYTEPQPVLHNLPENELMGSVTNAARAEPPGDSEIAAEGSGCNGGDSADDILGSGMSDYRMQTLCESSASVVEGNPDSNDSDKETSMFGAHQEEEDMEDCLDIRYLMRKIEMTMKKHSHSENVSSLSSQSSSSKLASNRMAASYSELYVSLPDIDSSRASVTSHFQRQILPPRKYSSKTQSSPSLVSLSSDLTNKEVKHSPLSWEI